MNALKVTPRGSFSLPTLDFSRVYRGERAVLKHGQMREKIELLKDHSDLDATLSMVRELCDSSMPSTTIRPFAYCSR